MLTTSMGGAFPDTATAVASSGVRTWFGTESGLQMWDASAGDMSRWYDWMGTDAFYVQSVALGADATWVGTPGALIRVVGAPPE